MKEMHDCDRERKDSTRKDKEEHADGGDGMDDD
jgi:hypothetical protein